MKVGLAFMTPQAGLYSIQHGAHFTPLLKHQIVVLYQMPAGSPFWLVGTEIILSLVCYLLFHLLLQGGSFSGLSQFPHTYAHPYSAKFLRGTPCRLEVLPHGRSPLSGIHPVNDSHLGLPWPLALSIQFSGQFVEFCMGFPSLYKWLDTLPQPESFLTSVSRSNHRAHLIFHPVSQGSLSFNG